MIRQKPRPIILKVNPGLAGQHPTVSLTAYKSLFEELTLCLKNNNLKAFFYIIYLARGLGIPCSVCANTAERVVEKTYKKVRSPPYKQVYIEFYHLIDLHNIKFEDAYKFSKQKLEFLKIKEQFYETHNISKLRRVKKSRFVV